MQKFVQETETQHKESSFSIGEYAETQLWITRAAKCGASARTLTQAVFTQLQLQRAKIDSVTYSTSLKLSHEFSVTPDICIKVANFRNYI